MAISTNPNDPLSDYLQTLQLRASVYASPEVCGRWRVNPTHAHPGPGFHLVAYGQGWLHLKGDSPPLQFHEGDLLVFPRGAWHVLSAEPVLESHDSYTDAGPPRSGAGLVCGQLTFAARTKNPVLDALPDVLVLPTRDEANAALLGPLTVLLAAESSRKLPGHGVILDRLAEVLFVAVLRHAVQTGLIHGGILGALTDPRLGPALASFHRSPGSQWRLNQLAATAGVSRSVFSDRFQTIVGMTPMQYITHWRMLVAAIRLGTSSESVAQVAAALGYQTEAAFRRAFKRHHGIGPGAVRRDGRDPHNAAID
jgi:AraC-like DNA-binding protein